MEELDLWKKYKNHIYFEGKNIEACDSWLKSIFLSETSKEMEEHLFQNQYYIKLQEYLLSIEAKEEEKGQKSDLNLLSEFEKTLGEIFSVETKSETFDFLISIYFVFLKENCTGESFLRKNIEDVSPEEFKSRMQIFQETILESYSLFYRN
jgi:hypothetical protein